MSVFPRRRITAEDGGPVAALPGWLRASRGRLHRNLRCADRLCANDNSKRRIFVQTGAATELDKFLCMLLHTLSSTLDAVLGRCLPAFDRG